MSAFQDDISEPPRGPLPALDRVLHLVVERLHVGTPGKSDFGGEGVGESLDGIERFMARAAYRGLAARPVRLSLREVADLSGEEAPAITFENSGPGAAGACTLVWGAVGGALKCTRVDAHSTADSRESLDRLAARLGTDVDRPRDWVVVAPAAPLHAASADHGHDTPPQARLWELLRPERRDLIRVVEFAIGVGLLGLATPVAVQALVNSVAMGGLRQPLLVLVFMLFVFLAFSGVLRISQAFLVEIIQRRIFARIAADLAWRLPRITQAVHDRAHGAELVNRFFEVMTVQKAAATLLLDGVATLLQAIIGLVVLAFYHPWLLGFDSILVACLLGIVFLLGRGATETAIAESRAKYAVAAWLENVARNSLTFKFYGGPDHAEERTDLLSHGYLHARGRHYRVVLRQNVALAVLSAVAGTALLGLGGLLVMDGQLSLGQLVAAELIVTSLLSSFTKFGKQLESYYDLLAASDKLGHLIDLPLEPQEGSDVAGRWNRAPMELEASDLHFSHEHSPPVFRGLDLRAEPGERVAVLGAEGSGKGTLATLLVGLRRPDRGTIRINRFDLRELRLVEVRRRIGLASEPEVIEDTIYENVRLGRGEVTHERVVSALSATGLLEGLRLLAGGLQTRLVPGGAPLSGGQVRRLMLARALAGDPELMIVDGLLDDLDEDDRDDAVAALLDPARRFTLVLLTRSAAIASVCDRTVRLESGRGRDAGGPAA